MAGDTSLLSKKRKEREQQIRQTQSNAAPKKSRFPQFSKKPRPPVAQTPRTRVEKTINNPTKRPSRVHLQFLVASTLIIAFVTWLTIGPVLKVSQINCVVDQTAECTEPVQAELHQHLGKHMFAVNLESTFDKIRTAYPLYQEFSLAKQLPSTITVEVTSSPPAYLITDGQQTFAINQNGVVTVYPSSEQLPSVTFSPEQFSQLKLHQPLELQLHQDLTNFFQSLQSISFEYTKVEWHTLSEIHFFTQNKKLVTSLENLENQITLGKKLLEYPLENQDWNTIDLRFNKPILRKEE